MGRFSMDDADNYGSSSTSSFFSLKNDGDIARVRFMYNGMNDVVGYAVHEVDVGDKKRYVNCLRSYNDPKSKCPFCDAGNFQRAKLFIPLYDEKEKTVKIWDRGKKYFQKISSICGRYASANTPLVSHIFEVERNGKAGDTGTAYEFYEVDKDETTLEDLPEIPDIIGGIVLDKTADEMLAYLDDGEFPDGDSAPAKRPSRQDDEERPSGRRTPSRGRGDRGDTF